MATPEFPNGFESWQKTHFEVVEAICFIRDLEDDRRNKSFSEWIDQSATEEIYTLALNLTNKFEYQTRDKKREQSLFDEIEAFVASEVKHL